MNYKKYLPFLFFCTIFLMGDYCQAQVASTTNQISTTTPTSTPIVETATTTNSVCGEGEKELTFIARNQNNEFITGINFELYKQEVDADNNVKPGQAVVSGKTDALLGKKTVKFKSDESFFAIRVWHLNKNVGAFFSYNNQIGCGTIITKRLSGIKFTLRDTDGNLKKNTSYSVYEQNYDADNNPIKEKKELVTTLNTGEIGANVLYLADKNMAIDGNSGGYYIFESLNKNGGLYLNYDYEVKLGGTKLVDYAFSVLELTFKNQNNTTYPGGTNVELYEQKYDTANKPILGKKVTSAITNDRGTAVFEYPEGIYAARIPGENGQFKNYFDLTISDQIKRKYELKNDLTWEPAEGTCKENSSLKVTVRALDGQYLQNMNFELYEQKNDANNLPITQKVLVKGNTGTKGFAEVVFNPSSLVKYALKIYQKNSSNGEFWYFNNIQFVCGKNRDITKYLPKTRVLLYDKTGTLIKDQKFSIYSQKFDADNQPIVDQLVGEFNTGKTGSVDVYLSAGHPYNLEKLGVYMMKTMRGGKEFKQENIRINPEKDLNLSYHVSGLVLKLKKANGEGAGIKDVQLFEKKMDENGKMILGDKALAKYKTDVLGQLSVEYPEGEYAIVLKDDLGQNNIFYDLKIQNGERLEKVIKTSLVNIKVPAGVKAISKVMVYQLLPLENNQYYRGNLVGGLTVGKGQDFVEASLKEGFYLFVILNGKEEYAKAFYIVGGEKQNLTLDLNKSNIYSAGRKYGLVKPVSALAEKLKGHILLQVEGSGQAWYVDMVKKEKHYLKDGAAAYEMMRSFGVGIKNSNLEKIAIGVDERLGVDTDADGLSDATEQAIGTDINKIDSDGDGFVDGVEVESGFNPLGPGKIKLDNSFAKKSVGKIFLQTERHGEAWYINPKDGKRYYLKDGNAAYEVMRYLSLGVKNSDLAQIN